MPQSGAKTQVSSAPPGASQRELQETVRTFVEVELPIWLERELACLRGQNEELARVIDAMVALTLRGGKRARAVLLVAGHVAAGGELDLPRLGPALFAMELLQSYLLIHDDWMDGDEIRRGGPSVHTALAKAYGDEKQGAIAAILAGDFASSLAQRALAYAPFPERAVVRAQRAFALMQERVVAGQILDVRAAARTMQEVERMHAFKTASYTTEGPITIGALLADAPEEMVKLLTSFARPLGVAFQLRDDVLGVFGDPKTTGKPLYGDLFEGKRTSLVGLASAIPGARALLERAPSEARCRELGELIRDKGILADVEARIQELVSEARSALAQLHIDERGRKWFDETIVFLTERTS